MEEIARAHVEIRTAVSNVRVDVVIIVRLNPARPQILHVMLAGVLAKELL